MFSRTSSGIRNSHLFYKGFYVVIVEGTNDCPFWSKFFPDELNGYKIKLKPVGGRLEVQKYINEILTGETKLVVAVDSDYNYLLGDSHNHSRIVETQYHSIENLMLCLSNITSIIRNLSHDMEYDSVQVEKWLEGFDSATFSLMIADLLIEQKKLAQQCVGDNCFPFLVKNNYPEFDIAKINNAISKLSLPQQDLDAVTSQFQNFKPRFHIRGHFFFSAVLCFVTYEAKRIRKKSVPISNDSFYAMSISLCGACISTDSILEAIQKQAFLASQEVTNLLASGN